jgi:signal transduction histidine kinase
MVVLETSKLFHGLSASELDSLRKAVQIQTFPPGKVIFTEGDEGHGFYMIKGGKVHISALVNQDERRTLSHLISGDFFGEMAVLDNEPRSATATAVDETDVYYIPRSDILRLLEGSPTLAVNLMREFSRRLREFNRRYIQEVLQAERLALVGRFARSIVHDFKNPLNVIGIAADLAGMESATLGMRQMAKSRIRKQVDRLSNMINELLEFTRGSQGAIVPAQTDYGLFVQQLLQEISLEMTENSVLIECENDPPSVSLLFDPSRLNHVFNNLIHNAIDAMPHGGKIKLRFAVTETEVITEIEDSGQGISPEIAPRLFDAFATYGKAQGTGLGLSICKKIIEDHRGRIQARNLPGRGAVFSFTLPIRH